MADPYSTQDLYEAAACLLHGHPVTVVRLPNGRARFDFPAAATETARAYALGLTGPLLVYGNALRRLKKQMNEPTTQLTTEATNHDARRLR